MGNKPDWFGAMILESELNLKTSQVCDL